MHRFHAFIFLIALSTATDFNETNETLPNEDVCGDYDDLCCFWATLGECDSNAYWMRPFCQNACGSCGCIVENALTCESNRNISDCPKLEPRRETKPTTIRPNKFRRPTAVRSKLLTPPGPNSPSTSSAESKGLTTIGTDKLATATGYTVNPLVSRRRRTRTTTATTQIYRTAPTASSKKHIGTTIRTPSAVTVLEEETSEDKGSKGEGEHESEGDEYYADDECFDSHENCHYWAKSGECESNEYWMLPECQKSCNSCGKFTTPAPRTDCTNNYNMCRFWALMGECKKNVDWMKINCARSCRECTP
uniref:ShKT domain-containing protein n=1 Tax=Plectus sambesii TaxID=2011161 RepID=A0A914XA22_9BILA